MVYNFSWPNWLGVVLLPRKLDDSLLYKLCIVHQVQQIRAKGLFMYQVSFLGNAISVENAL